MTIDTCKTSGEMGFELGQSRAWVCEAVQTIAREHTSIWGEELWPALNSPSPRVFGRPARLCCTWAWSPLYICSTVRPVPRQSGHLQESSFPLWVPGLVMPRPCHTDCSFRSGKKLRKKQKSYRKQYTFFLIYKKIQEEVRGLYWPKPLEATSVAMRIGAFPNLNSGKRNCSEMTCSSMQVPNNQWELTIENPVPFLLAFISMDSHCRPPAETESTL